MLKRGKINEEEKKGDFKGQTLTIFFKFENYISGILQVHSLLLKLEIKSTIISTSLIKWCECLFFDIQY